MQKSASRSNEIIEAKLTNYRNCHFNTYQEVQVCGQYTLSIRRVITNIDGKTKARLVVRGFEEEYFMPRDSPTVGKGTMRIFLAISSSNKWTVKATNIKYAFLQGLELRRDVYIKPPRERSATQEIVWKLKHGMYGFKDSGPSGILGSGRKQNTA